MYEMKKSGCYGIAFIDPNTINQDIWEIEHCKAAVEESMLEFLKRLNTFEDILLPLQLPVSHTVLYYKFYFCLLAS